jgi:hypothetical protein
VRRLHPAPGIRGDQEMGSVQIARPSYQIDAPVRPRNVLGEVLAPRRQHYVLHIPLCLFLAAIISWILPTEPMMVVACTVGSLAAIYMAYDWLLRSAPLRFSTVIALALLLGYCLGTMNTWLTEARADMTLAQMYSRDPAALARAVSTVLLTCGILIAVGELYERPIFGEDFRIKVDGRMLAFIYVGAATIVVGFLTKRLAFGGIGLSETGEVSPINAFLKWFFFPLVALTVSAFLASPSGIRKKLLGATAALLMLLLMTQWRRDQIYTAFLIVFAVRFSGYKLTGNLFKKLLYLAILGAVVVSGALTYQLLRSLGQFGGAHQVALIPRLERAATLVEEGTALSTAVDLSRQNVTRRTFILTYYSDLLEASSQYSPAYGTDIISQIEAIIPHAFFPNKTVVQEEVVASAQFGTSPIDQPNSILTGGVIDFGLFGVIVYPLIAAWLLRKFVDVVSRYLPALPAAFIVLTVIFVCVQAENLASSYILIIRNDLLFSVILLLFFSIPAFRFRSRA